jgi:anti-sigma regulatory factor (Ser/Thr protein kinase)
MGELRSALRAYALDTEGPAEVVTKLSQFAEAEQSRMATLIYATLNLDTSMLEFARAGHPYPVLVQSDGTASFLTEATGPPLGTGGTLSYEAQRLKLEPGEALFLYTDGLIERRGEELSQGEAALIEAAKGTPDDAESKCWSIISRLTEGVEIADDIAALMVQSLGLDEQLEYEVPASARELAGVRHLMRRWVAANGGTDDDCAAVAVAVTEACANAVEHAYESATGTIQITAVRDGETATITIADQGAWREPRRGNRGRGIPVMKEFVDEISIDRSEAGTTVEIRRTLGARPTRLTR